MVEIDTGGTLFYSLHDELSFFAWAKEIECVVSIDRGVLSIDPEKIDDSCLRDLIALLFRYEIPMNQLGIFSNNENECWFKNKTTYWYKRVFPSNSTLMKIINRESVESFFGYWPKFSDATINKLAIDSRAKELRSSIYYIDVDKNKMAEIGLLFIGIKEVELNELREYNVLDELVIKKRESTNEGYDVEFDACCGVTGNLSCESILVEYINA